MSDNIAPLAILNDYASDIEQESESPTLEQKLEAIFTCQTCNDLPEKTIYQCTNGDLICGGCLSFLLSEETTRNIPAVCTVCQLPISRDTVVRNYAAEHVVRELPAKCKYCHQEFARNFLEHHEEIDCNFRIVSCKYSRIGCQWTGYTSEKLEHEKICIYPNRTGAEVMEDISSANKKFEEEKQFYTTFFNLMSLETERIMVVDLQLKLTSITLPVSFSAEFSAFNQIWILTCVFIVPQSGTSNPECIYKLMLQTKPDSAMTMNFVILRGPFGKVKVIPRFYKFCFTDADTSSPFVSLPISDKAEYNRLFSKETLHCRILMFHVTN